MVSFLKLRLENFKLSWVIWFSASLTACIPSEGPTFRNCTESPIVFTGARNGGKWQDMPNGFVVHPNENFTYTFQIQDFQEIRFRLADRTYFLSKEDVDSIRKNLEPREQLWVFDNGGVVCIFNKKIRHWENIRGCSDQGVNAAAIPE